MNASTMEAEALPSLRDDLGLIPGPAAEDGAPTWTIYDPVRNRYFRIGQSAFDLLSRWELGNPAAVLQAAGRNAPSGPSLADLEGFVQFLGQNGLIRQESPEAVARLASQAQAMKKHWATRLLHGYLFFRIPLIRPDRLLAFLEPRTQLFRTQGFVTLLLLLGTIGALLALRQWDGFLADFPRLASWQGVAWSGGALLLAKVVHELGHALSARRFGCRVPTMGVAFMVMFPLLYTDVSDAWRLTDKRQRLRINAGGVIAELKLALFATFLWGFLPDGPVRSAAFLLAAIAWVSTLAINLNPFMKFDGYYLLADRLGLDNLQDRAFALARWRLREALFGLKEAPPEQMSDRMRRTVILYAYGTWIYRFFLFLGIALLVYFMFFKLLGLFLMVVEVWWFILRPIQREGAEWWKRRSGLSLNRQTATTLAVFALLAGLALIPWRSTLALPGVVRATERQVLFAPVPARIQTIHARPGSQVAAGDPLFTFTSPELDHAIDAAHRRTAITRRLLSRHAASPETRQRVHILRRELAAEERRLAGLKEQQAQLSLTAPLDGVWTDAPPDLHPGRWVEDALMLGRITGLNRLEVAAYVAEEDQNRFAAGARARFIPDDPARPPIDLVVREVSRINAPFLNIHYLASTFGGRIEVEPDAEGRLVPLGSIYRVLLAPEPHRKAPSMTLSGVVRVEAPPRSLFYRVWTAAWGVIIRESGF